MRRIAALVGLVLVVGGSPVAAQPAPAPDDPLAAQVSALVSGAQVTIEHSGDQIVATVSGPAPDWPGLRDLGGKAFAIVAAGAPGATVELWFKDAGVVARASTIEGTTTVHVEVGDGDVMLDDRSIYALAARVKITVPTTVWEGMQIAVAGRPTCAGTVENPGNTDVEVTAHCKIFGSAVDQLARPQPRAVLVDEAHAVGTIAPGAQQKFSFKLPSVSKSSNVPLPGESIVRDLVADVTLEVGGSEVAYVDLERFEIATDWLRVMDALRADGLRLDGYRPLSDPAVKAMFDELVVDGPDDLASRPAAERKKLGKRVWKLIHDHYARYKRPLPREGIVVRSNGKAATLSDGRLGAFD